MKMDECLDFIEKYKRKSLNTNKLQIDDAADACYYD